MSTTEHQPEQIRIDKQTAGQEAWLKWGPYLSERQWGTVREDYSANGNAWGYLPHDHARSRAYRWGEDGLAGISDDQQYLCFALGLWNGQDSILKERLFGLTGPEGNHGEDVKELYYYLDNTPSHAYMKYLYKYPQAAFPYDQLVEENAHRDKHVPEFELLDTGVFDHDRYFDVEVTYAKAGTEDLLIQVDVYNRGDQAAPIYLLPTLWFRNEWSFGLREERPTIERLDTGGTLAGVRASHPVLGTYYLQYEATDRAWMTENETNQARLFMVPNEHPFVKDAFHKALVGGGQKLPAALQAREGGTKFSPVYQREVPAGEQLRIRLRLSTRKPARGRLGASFDKLLKQRLAEADAFYAQFCPPNAPKALIEIQRQAYAGMLWTKQFYYIDIPQWLEGDPGKPNPPEARKHGRNSRWRHLNNRDIISMPDKWEYPWYAVWDLAFHCIPLARIHPEFAKNQLILMLREWYMSPNGQIPAYEWNFSDVNPPVHAWASLRVYQIEKQQRGKGDIDFLKRVFQKLMLNFTWWVNRKDSNDNNVFEGGFLGLDNIGVFDRSNELPGGGTLEQADGTSWMAMYALNLMEMALEISRYDPSFEDVATKFFEHFIYIAETMNHLGEDGSSLWDEEDGFFYDVLLLPGDRHIPIKVRSLVGLTTLFAVNVIPKEVQAHVPDFMKRLNWFKQYREKMGKFCAVEEKENGDILLALVPMDKLHRLLEAMLDPDEFLSGYGIRSLSKRHETEAYTVTIDDEVFSIRYEPAESSTYLFGGNSNWRGPIWFPMNYMLIESLYAFCHFFDGKQGAEMPKGSGNWQSLTDIAQEVSRRLIRIFLPDEQGHRPVNDDVAEAYQREHFRDLILFYEYFHGETGRGVGASHQTGWTGLVATLIDEVGWKV